MIYNIRNLGPSDNSAKTIERITKLVNESYRVAEAGIWVDGFERVTEPEAADFVNTGKLIVAEINSNIVGAVYVDIVGPYIGEFGMLACDPSSRRNGIGSALVTAAETKCRLEGCTTMSLELLYPKDWKHPFKEMLKTWYQSLGYRREKEKPFEHEFPHLVRFLATQCIFSMYIKKLGKTNEQN